MLRSRADIAALAAAGLLVAGLWPGTARAQDVGERFRDCESCPEMVVVPAGRFTMGSPPGEKKRNEDEGPQREVVLAAPFAVGRSEVTWAEYGAFVAASGHSTEEGCWLWWDDGWKVNEQMSWRGERPERTDEHPVVCVSWHDAAAYAAWLAETTGKPYRLLSEAEWEYAARAGTGAVRYWGDERDAMCRYANGADLTAKEVFTDWSVANCSDGHVYGAPVAGFEANAFGLHDVLGNAWEWVADCFHPSYEGAPTDGSAWVEGGDCERRMLRGGSWTGSPRALRSADRRHEKADAKLHLDYGFRVARDLE